MLPPLTFMQVTSYVVCALSLLTLLFSILGIALPYWIKLLSNDVPPVLVANFGLWNSNYPDVVPSTCTTLSSIIRPAQALCVIGGLVFNLFAFVATLDADLRNVNSPTNWRRKLLAFILLAVTSGILISGIVIYVTGIYRICPTTSAKLSIGYPLGLMIAATPLGGLAALFYGFSLGYTLQDKQVKNSLHYTMGGLTVVSVVFTIIAIVTPTWLTSETPFYSTVGLWQRCYRNSSMDAVVCTAMSEERNGNDFQAAQGLSIVALLVLVVSGTLAILTTVGPFKVCKKIVKFIIFGFFLLSFILLSATYWQFLGANLRASQAMQLDFALAFMIFALTVSGAREVVQGLVLGYSMAAVDIIVQNTE